MTNQAQAANAGREAICQRTRSLNGTRPARKRSRSQADHSFQDNPPGRVLQAKSLRSAPWRKTHLWGSGAQDRSLAPHRVSVHSKVRAKSRKEAERMGKHMIQPLLSLQRLSLDERQAKVCSQYGKDTKEASRIFSWRHTGFNVHRRVVARTKTEARRREIYMV